MCRFHFSSVGIDVNCGATDGAQPGAAIKIQAECAAMALLMRHAFDATIINETVKNNANKAANKKSDVVKRVTAVLNRLTGKKAGLSSF